MYRTEYMSTYVLPYSPYGMQYVRTSYVRRTYLPTYLAENRARHGTGSLTGTVHTYPVAPYAPNMYEVRRGCRTGGHRFRFDAASHASLHDIRCWRCVRAARARRLLATRLTIHCNSCELESPFGRSGTVSRRQMISSWPPAPPRSRLRPHYRLELDHDDRVVVHILSRSIASVVKKHRRGRPYRQPSRDEKHLS